MPATPPSSTSAPLWKEEHKEEKEVEARSLRRHLRGKEEEPGEEPSQSRRKASTPAPKPSLRSALTPRSLQEEEVEQEGEAPTVLHPPLHLLPPPTPSILSGRHPSPRRHHLITLCLRQAFSTLGPHTQWPPPLTPPPRLPTPRLRSARGQKPSHRQPPNGTGNRKAYGGALTHRSVGHLGNKKQSATDVETLEQ